MSKYLLRYIFAASFFYGTNSFSSSPVPENTLPTVEAILSSFEQQEQKLFFQQNCFLMTYTRTVGNNLLDGKSMPAVRYCNGRIGDVWMVEASLTNENSQGTKQKTQYFSRKDVIWEWRESSNSGVVVPFGHGRNMYQNWHYFHNYGITPYRAIAESNGLSFHKLMESAKTESTLFPLNNKLLPGCIKNNLADYRLRSNQENIEKFPCRVIEHQGVDVIWVDTSYGNAIRKRITYWGPGEPQKNGNIQPTI